MMYILLSVVLCFVTPVSSLGIRTKVSYVLLKDKNKPAYRQDIKKLNVMDVSLSDLDSYIDAIRRRVNYLTKYGTKLTGEIETLERYISIWNGTFPSVMTKESKMRQEATCESADALKVLGLLVTKFHKVEVDTQVLNDSIISVSKNLNAYKTSMNQTAELFDKEIESLWKTLKDMQKNQKSAEARISALETGVKGLTSRVVSLEKKMTHAQAAQRKTDTRTNALEQGLSKVTQQVNRHQQTITDIQNTQNSIIRNMSLVESKITAHFNQKVNELNKKLTSLETDQKSAWRTIRSVQRDLVPMKETLYYLRSTLTQFMTEASANITKTMRLLRDAHIEKYIGCYLDSSNRIMKGYHSGSTAMTKPLCAGMCRHAGYNYYGLQAGRTCFCAQTFVRSQKLPDSYCTTPCNGDETTSCGGSWRMAIYKIYHFDQM